MVTPRPDARPGKYVLSSQTDLASCLKVIIKLTIIILVCELGHYMIEKE